MDPGLEAELKRRGLTVPSGGGAGVAGGLWAEIEKRGMTETAKGAQASAKSQALTDEANKPGLGASLWKSIVRGIPEGVTEMGQALARQPTALPGAGPRLQQQIAPVEATQQKMREDFAKEAGLSEEAFQRNPETQAHPTAAGIGRGIGQMIPGVALGAAAGPMGVASRGAPLLSRVGTGMAQGAAGAATQPVNPNADWEAEKKKQVMTGLAIGGAIPGLGGVMAPAMPTIHQFEESAKRALPWLTRFLTGAEERTLDGFNRTLVGQAVEAIGGDVPRNMKAGWGLMDHALTQFNTAYEKIKPNLSLDWNHATDRLKMPLSITFKPAVDQIAGNLTPDLEKPFWNFVEQKLKSRFDQNGLMTGEAFKAVQNDLHKKMTTAFKTRKDELGQAYDELDDLLRSALKDQNPHYAVELGNIDKGYSMLKKLIPGAAKPESFGVFTPSDVLGTLYRTTSENQMASGNALGDGLLQGYAKLGYQILGGGRPRPGQVGELLMHALEPSGLAPRMGRAVMRGTTMPAGRALKAGAPVLSPASGAAGDRARQRLTAAQKVGELQKQRYYANRRGDITEVEALGSRLAEAHKDYRDLGGMA